MGLKKLVFINVCVIMIHAIEYENVYGPSYGKKWILMTDDNGITHYVNFTKQPEAEGPMMMMASSRDVYFYLYTRNNSDSLNFKNGKYRSSHFDPKSDLKVITHGWYSSADVDWVANMTSAFLRRSPTNVITVDWSSMSRNLNYPQSVNDTKYVGKKVAEMINAIADTYSVNGSRVHLIGHSLGAQVMGYAGSFSKQPIARITGLDPARPLFELPDMGDANRLDSTDADFVDVIHTCGGLLGYNQSHGHADFYPNNGRAMQPGCHGVQHILEACSHAMSHHYFIESIESDRFVSKRCVDWTHFEKGDCSDNPTNLMGEPVDISRHGNYFLYTPTIHS